ncbi:flagellar basal body-associated protein FliL [Vibrio sp. V27_P1S3P104]|uniref:flagellar basal body-associated protein FliL n=1 Tax=unclassified Vibrio TaxID=2614977 RepID=UPI0013725226|nr:MULTISPECIES: flagellar basal body-associated protein FliL [unclassified Vibrio]NAW68821.1 flagellar basal body-associated protein FliL [Vibrio sp. V28_P6S34P95]NAX06469.1 flagellar basal body-associated protein FliL [Vibrio sp. V30_P3S12P165]NAX34409.1 flagellar basal body-associated protein FliL [Vibrio sp. V29_P1S30P107]NAX37823.1 flagellar basal body-associated protein FliL [Vibrio sp. V27_P1S3P104]NAX40501.1 flagellar basal body-associated protein FliL [Vibrio sp. V26_P1S5P106]
MAVDENAPKSKKKLLIIVGAVVALLLIAGGAFFFIGSGSPEPKQAQQAQRAATIEPVSYVNIAQPFVFNVSGENRGRMVQVKVQLMVRGSKNENLARFHSPLIESTLLATFASATVEQLRTTSGRTELRDKATEDIKAAMTQVVGEPVIERVLFTDFVMQ